MGFSQKVITTVSAQNVPWISILRVLNRTIRVQLQIYSGYTGGTSCNYRQCTLCELSEVSELISPPPPDQKGQCKEGVEGKGEGLEQGGLRQETQGCWHVLFFYDVISIPMHLALIFDEPLAQHPPLSPYHPFPSHPLFCLFIFLLQALSLR